MSSPVMTEPSEIVRHALELAIEGFAHGNYDKRADAQAALTAHIEALTEEIETLKAGLADARNQIEYLDGKFQPTGTSAAMLARLDALLNKGA